MACLRHATRSQWLTAAHRCAAAPANINGSAPASKLSWTRLAGHVATTRRWQSDFTALQHEMSTRKIQPVFDDLCPTPSYRLDVSLADYLPSVNPPRILPATTNEPVLQIPNHLIYFEPTKRASEMLPDGTNPDQSPGEPFTRRMWAGGHVLYDNSNPLPLDSSRGVCAEFIRSVSVKGNEGAERLFVRIERRLAKATQEEVEAVAAAQSDEQARETLEHRVRQRLWRDEDDDFGPASIIETRNIVFMRSRTKEEAAAEAAKAKGKILKPQHKPDWQHTLTGDPKLLFRFSALTFNAHAIHLDPEYCREVEGHRERLFHGPLSFVFMVTLLRDELKKAGNEVIKSVEYRNLAPLYCNEPIKFCGTKVGDGKWEVWCETPDGGMAVKANIIVEPGR